MAEFPSLGSVRLHGSALASIKTGAFRQGLGNGFSVFGRTGMGPGPSSNRTRTRGSRSTVEGLDVPAVLTFPGHADLRIPVVGLGDVVRRTGLDGCHGEFHTKSWPSVFVDATECAVEPTEIGVSFLSVFFDTTSGKDLAGLGVNDDGDETHFAGPSPQRQSLLPRKKRGRPWSMQW